MAVNVNEILKSNPDGAIFVSSGMRSVRDTEEAFEQAHEFERLAFSGTLRNPKTALGRAHELLEVAAAQETKAR